MTAVHSACTDNAHRLINPPPARSAAYLSFLQRYLRCHFLRVPSYLGLREL